MDGSCKLRRACVTAAPALALVVGLGRDGRAFPARVLGAVDVGLREQRTHGPAPTVRSSVGARGFEPRTSRSRSARDAKLRHAPSAAIIHELDSRARAHSLDTTATDAIISARL